MHRETKIRKAISGIPSRFVVSRFQFLIVMVCGLFGILGANTADASCGAQSKKSLLIKLSEKEQAYMDNLSLSYSLPNHGDPTLPCRIPICKSQRDKGSPDPIKPMLIVRSFKFVMHTSFVVHVLHEDLSYAIAEECFSESDGKLVLIDRPPIVGLI